MREKLTNLVSKTDAKAKEKSSNDKHNEVFCEGVKRDADQEDDGGNLHSALASVSAANSGGAKAGNESSEVERGCEELEALVVILAIVVFMHLVLFYVH